MKKVISFPKLVGAVTDIFNEPTKGIRNESQVLILTSSLKLSLKDEPRQFEQDDLLTLLSRQFDFRQ